MSSSIILLLLLLLLVTTATTFCPNDCSDHGSCNNDNECQCDSGFETADCSFACGYLGETCCSGGNCMEGSCLTYSSKLDGVCSSFGGVYSLNGQQQCTMVNFYSLNCDCPNGFKAVCYDVGSNGNLLCSCGIGAPGQDFGEMYITGNSGDCIQGSITGQCNCPSGSLSYGPIVITLTSGSANLYYCSNIGSPLTSFGGLYEIYSSGSCQAGNSLSSNQCSCPDNEIYNSCAIGIAVNNDGSYIGVCHTVPSHAGIQTSITQQAIINLVTDLIQSEIQQHQTLQIPDISGHDYEVSGIQFSSLAFNSISVTVGDTNRLDVSLTEGSLNGIIGKIEVKKGIVKTHCDAHPFDLSAISITGSLYTSLPFMGGHMLASLEVANVQASVGNIDVDIHGNVLCHLFHDDIIKAIKNAVTNAFPNQVAPAVQNTANTELLQYAATLNSLATTYPVAFSLLPITSDLSLIGCEAYIAQSQWALTLPMKGSFFHTNTTKPMAYVEVPFTTSPFPMSPENMDNDIELCISNYVIESLLWTIYQSEVAELVITNSDLPTNLPFQLNTSNVIIKQLAPSLYTQYPDSAIILQFTSSPSALNTSSPHGNVTFQEGIFIEALTNMAVLVVNDTNTNPSICNSYGSQYLCNAFSLQMYTGVNISVSVTELSATIEIQGKVRDLLVSWELSESNVGRVNEDVLDALDQLLIPQIQQQINKQLAQLPFSLSTSVPPFQFSNIVTNFYVNDDTDGYICLGADISIISS